MELELVNIYLYKYILVYLHTHECINICSDIFNSPNTNSMSYENHKTLVRKSIVLVLITICSLLRSEFADGRTFAARRHGLELPKHKGTLKSIEVNFYNLLFKNSFSPSLKIC